MRFTIIVATRNRPVLAREAVESVLRQDCTDWEMVLVNDGSDDVHLDGLAGLDRLLGPRARRIDLPQRSRGHGQSLALNTGAAAARGEYLCFLDDDDVWTDDGHLSRVARAIDAQPAAPDLVLANQLAYRNAVPVTGAVWIEDLLARAGKPLVPDAAGAYAVTPADLLRCTGFAHVNATTIRRAHFERIGGLDETIRYECDRDFYLRAIDQAGTILYLPEVMARHNIPDAKAGTSMSTMLNTLDKLLFQLRVLDKAILFSRHAEIRAHARQHKVYALKKIAQETAGKAPGAASFYAQEAALTGFNLRWSAYALFLRLRRMLRPE
jgi:glycosyltransferase involved in cell wall biosynthesis